MACLTRVGLAEKAEHYPEQLSGGQQQRVAIARSLAMQPQVMLFDEVTSALDPQLTSEVLKVMEDLARGGMTMILVTHEMGFARRVAGTVIYMRQGRVWETLAGRDLDTHARPNCATSSAAGCDQEGVLGMKRRTFLAGGLAAASTLAMPALADTLDTIRSRRSCSSPSISARRPSA